MKLLAFEYITGGGLAGETLPDSLQAEGDLMLQALVSDLLELPDIQVTVLRDTRLPQVAGVENLKVRSVAEFDSVWRGALANTDACWIIAPETHAVLEKLSRQVEMAGVCLLNSTSEAVALTASKSRTARQLSEHGITTLNHSSLNGHVGKRWVVKPDRAAGCENIRLFTHQDAAEHWLATQDDPEQWLLQPWLAGEHLSLSLLCKQGAAIVLSVNRQLLSERQGELYLSGCVVNAGQTVNEFVQLASKVAAVIPGLWGYVGIDLVHTETGSVVIEINPRLTTSYVGLRQAMGINLAAMVMSLLTQPLPDTIPRSVKSVHLEIPDVC